MDLMLTTQDLKKIELEDDPSTPTGGISYIGETADNFVAEAISPNCHNIMLKELNSALKECGIKPIPLKSLI